MRATWYVSNVSIIFACFMLLYYHSWMFYNHFITTLYHFLGLTYWHSAKVLVDVSACFLLRRISVPNGVQSWRNFWEIFFGPEDTQWTKEVPERWAVESTTHQGAPGSGPLSTASDAYKYPNIQKILGESTKNTSSRRKFQNLEIQSNTITEGFIILMDASPMMHE